MLSLMPDFTSRLVLGLSCVLAGATIARAEPVPLYGRFEQAFTAGPDAPAFADFNVRFTAPSGRAVTRPGFYDGGRTYRVRFMPAEEGRWSYATVAAVPGLENQSGTFDVRRATDPKTRFARHGPVRIAASGTHLEHLDKTPFFFLGDTVWNGPLLAKPDHWQTFLGDRVAKRFTAIQFVMCAPWRTAPTNAEGLVAYAGETDVAINPEFYRRIDQRMDAIADAGMLSAPVLLWAWGKRDAGQALSEADAVRVIRYQVARYQAHPVLWLLNGDGKYEGAVADRWKRIGRAVFAGKVNEPAAYHPPVTLHPGGRQWPYASFRGEAWLDVYGYQSGHSNAPDNFRWINAGPVSKAWRQEPAVAYMNLEPPYEAHLFGGTKKPFTAHDVRRACYWSLLAAPVAGLTYGGHGIWSWQEVDGLPYDHPYTGMAKAWQEAKDLPGASDMGRMADLFTSIDWPALRPAPELLAVQPAAAADAAGRDAEVAVEPNRAGDPAKFVAAAKSEAGDLAIFYLPVGGDVTVRADRLKSGLKAEWFDPRTGNRRPAAAKDGGVYAAPDAQDWVLLMR